MILFCELDANDEVSLKKSLPEAKAILLPISKVNDVKPYQDCTVLSCFIHSRLTAEVLAALPKLQLICTRSVGVDHINLQVCSERGIKVCNVPDYGSHVIAEHVFALLLSTMRHINAGDARVEQGVFDYHGLRGIALKDKTIGIVGTGKIGRAVAKIAHGFSMKILAVDLCRIPQIEKDYGVQYVEFDQLLAQSDFLTLHVPLLPSTKHLINKQTLQKIKPGLWLVNTARGSLIDSQALLEALENNTVSHALLDVLEHEENLQEQQALINHPRVITTPHIGFYADDSMRNMLTETLQTITQWQQSLPLTYQVQPVEKICNLPGIFKKL